MDHTPANALLERSPELAGRYLVERELGRGTMGVVYEAFDVLLGRTVALKTIELAFTVGPNERRDFEERFFTEARVAARLSHPGIVVCHDVGKDPATGQLFIVFEHLQGHTLAERIADRHPVAWIEALGVVAGLARAIHHAHEHGIVHRDLKPANVFLVDSPAAPPAVKILDFGVARVESMRLRLTASGQSFGSPLYMSPEQALGQPTNARSDIFSLGSILCTLLLGRPWFDAPNIPEIFTRLLSEAAPRLSGLVQGLPPALDAVILRAMAKRPEERYDSARELADDLDDVLAGRTPRHAFGRTSSPDGTLPAALDLDAFLADLGGGTNVVRTLSDGDRTGTVDVLPRLVQEEDIREERRRRGWRVAVAALALAAAIVTLALGARARHVRDGSASDPARPAAVLTAPVLPLARIAVATAVPTPAARSWVVLDVKHSLRNGRLRIWIDGEPAADEALHAPVTKRIVAFAIREGRVAKPLELTPGRRTVKVQISWDDARRTAVTSVEARPDATRLLEIRLAGRAKTLELDWN